MQTQKSYIFCPLVNSNGTLYVWDTCLRQAASFFRCVCVRLICSLAATTLALVQQSMQLLLHVVSIFKRATTMIELAPIQPPSPDFSRPELLMQQTQTWPACCCHCWTISSSMQQRCIYIFQQRSKNKIVKNLLKLAEVGQVNCTLDQSSIQIGMTIGCWAISSCLDRLQFI